MIVESQLTVFHNSQIFLTETQNHHFLLGHDIYSTDPISCISEQQQQKNKIRWFEIMPLLKFHFYHGNIIRFPETTMNNDTLL